MRVDDFTATYRQRAARGFTAGIGYQTAEDLAAGTDAWRPTTLEVNHPLRTDGGRLYLLGHGYAPAFTVTFPDGAAADGEVQWRPVDPTTLLSEGATKFARPGVTDEAAPHQPARRHRPASATLANRVTVPRGRRCRTT